MSRVKIKRGKHHDDHRLVVRFRELAVLQALILEQQSAIEALRAQNRRAALAPPPTASDDSAEGELAVARDRIAELERVQSDLVSAVNEKERQRFALALELQSALIRVEEVENALISVDPADLPGEVPSEDTRLRETLRLQEKLLQEREEAIVELQDALIQAQEERIQGGTALLPTPSEDITRLGELLRIQGIQLREYEDNIAELTTAMRDRPATAPLQSLDPLLRALMLEYHATITAALAERDHAILTMTADSSAGMQRATD